jgi:DNA mismatch endonuclease (patch repair protein)
VADVFSKAKRSEVMSRIRGRDTGPERTVRSMLHRLGYRFRLHRAELPGHPDIILPRYRAIVFVHGCFWHRHNGCRFAYTPKSRASFWLKKLEGNVSRDKMTKRNLAKLGWKVITVWECDIHKPNKLAQRLDRLLASRSRITL